MDLSAARLWVMVVKELKQMFRDPKMKRIVFIAPVVQLLVFGYAVNTDVRRTATIVVDHDRTAESRRLVEAFTASGYFRVAARSQRPADLVSALDAGDAVVGLEIPAGFARAVRAGTGAQIQILVDGTDSNTGLVALGYATHIAARFGADVADGTGSAPPTAIDLRPRVLYNPDLASRVYNVPAVIGVLLMLMALLLTALAVVREREIGTLEQLMVSPLRPAELMLGKTIPVALVAVVDLVLVTAVAILWFGIPMRGTVVALVAAALLYILAGLAVGLFISTISKTQQEAFMTMFLFFLPAIILSGFLYPVSSMPRFFEWLTYANPIRYFLEVVRGIFLKGDGILDLWPQYLVLSAMAAALLWLAAARFRKAIA